MEVDQVMNLAGDMKAVKVANLVYIKVNKERM